MSFYFTADYTPPVISAVGIADGETYDGDQHTFTVIASSADTVSMTCYLDDRETGTFDETALAKHGGVFVFTMAADRQPHTLRFEAVDAAGH